MTLFKSIKASLPPFPRSQSPSPGLSASSSKYASHLAAFIRATCPGWESTGVVQRSARIRSQLNKCSRKNRRSAQRCQRGVIFKETISRVDSDCNRTATVKTSVAFKCTFVFLLRGWWLFTFFLTLLFFVKSPDIKPPPRSALETPTINSSVCAI